MSAAQHAPGAGQDVGLRAADRGPGGPGSAPEPAATSLSAFLDQVAGVLRIGLPERLWIAATVVDVKASTAGFTIELGDPALERGATLRVFLSNPSLASIRRDLAFPVDPLLLVGLTTCLRLAPQFSRRWGLGARVEALSRESSASLKARLLERVIATLKRERLWDRQHGLPRPRDITRIVVIHPAGAAGWGDIAGELGRWQRARLVVVRPHPVPFEGEHATAALVAAIGAASLPVAGTRPDLVLVVRGGGAKTGLAVLDEERIARAILACPVPVVCGTGHATDRSLAGAVSWRDQDTPSKALALVADIITVAARAAAADRQSIVAAAGATVLTHAGQLAARQQAVAAAAIQTLAATGHRLAALWSEVRVETRSLVAQVRQQDGALDSDLAAILAHVPQLIATLDHRLGQLLQAGLGRASACLGRIKAGEALVAQVHGRAEAICARQGDAVQRPWAEIVAAAGRRLDRETAALEAVRSAIEAGDLGRLMARGLVVVTDTAGRPLPTRAAAAAHAAQAGLQLHFSDGVLAVALAG